MNLIPPKSCSYCLPGRRHRRPEPRTAARRIERLRPLGIPVAVITNSSLLGLPDLRRDRLLADFLVELGPSVAYLSVPVRPPVMARVEPPDEAPLDRCYQQLTGRLPRVEYRGDSFYLRRFPAEGPGMPEEEGLS